MKKTKTERLPKPPGLLRQFITVAYDAVQRRRAYWALEKQSWSVDFLKKLLYQSARAYGTQLEMEIINKDGMILKMRTIDNQLPAYQDDDILNHLDDEVKIQRFIAGLRKL